VPLSAGLLYRGRAPAAAPPPPPWPSQPRTAASRASRADGKKKPAKKQRTAAPELFDGDGTGQDAGGGGKGEGGAAAAGSGGSSRPAQVLGKRSRDNLSKGDLNKLKRKGKGVRAFKSKSKYKRK
jgi:hypothetical protein